MPTVAMVTTLPNSGKPWSSSAKTAGAIITEIIVSVFPTTCRLRRENDESEERLDMMTEDVNTMPRSANRNPSRI